MPATFSGPLSSISDEENKHRQMTGQMFYAFRQQMIAERLRCHNAKNAFNDLRHPTRRERVRLWRGITNDSRPLPPQDPDPVADEALFDDTDPWVESPLNVDYGYNLHFAPGSYVNAGACFIDTTPIKIGPNTLLGPSVSLYSGSHPLSPHTRNGLHGPENGAPITIGADCWIGGNVTICPGVSIGRGCVVGAGSVVTKSFGEGMLIVGNPGRGVRGGLLAGGGEEGNGGGDGGEGKGETGRVMSRVEKENEERGEREREREAAKGRKVEGEGEGKGE